MLLKDDNADIHCVIVDCLLNERTSVSMCQVITGLVIECVCVLPGHQWKRGQWTKDEIDRLQSNIITYCQVLYCLSVQF